MKKTILKRFIVLAAVMMLMLTAAGCSGAAPAPKGYYATQTRMSAVDYNAYISKQLTTFASLINSRLVSIKNNSGEGNDVESDLASDAIDTMTQIREQVLVTYPSNGSDEHRKSVLEAMDVAISNMEAYRDAVDSGKTTSVFKTDFQNDFNNITSLAQMYSY